MNNHHLIIYTMLKSTYAKLKPFFFRKRSFQNFSEESFLQNLKHELSNNGNCNDVNNELKKTLNNHASLKAHSKV